MQQLNHVEHHLYFSKITYIILIKDFSLFYVTVKPNLQNDIFSSRNTSEMFEVFQLDTFKPIYDIFNPICKIYIPAIRIPCRKLTFQFYAVQIRR